MDCCAGDKECERALWAAIQRLTLEQLGQSILDLLSKSISQVTTTAAYVVMGFEGLEIPPEGATCLQSTALMTAVPFARLVRDLRTLACM